MTMLFLRYPSFGVHPPVLMLFLYRTLPLKWPCYFWGSLDFEELLPVYPLCGYIIELKALPS